MKEVNQMYVNPILVGVIGTILVEIGLLVIYGIYESRK